MIGVADHAVACMHEHIAALAVVSGVRPKPVDRGGTAMEGPRYIWWNFVSSRTERIEEAKQAWKTGRFKPVPGESEFIPLPSS